MFYLSAPHQPRKARIMTAVQEAVQTLAATARLAVKYAGMTSAAAVDLAARNAIQDAMEATTRTGVWATESTTEQIEAAQFAGAVARDALDGNYRPSVGNVRDAVIAAI